MLVFEESGKPEYTEKNLSEQGRKPITNSTHILRRARESIPSHIGRRRAPSPLHPPCSSVAGKLVLKPLIFDGAPYKRGAYFQASYSCEASNVSNFNQSLLSPLRPSISKVHVKWRNILKVYKTVTS